MRSQRFSLTPLVMALSRKFIESMLHVYRDVILRGPLLNQLIPLLHILIDCWSYRPKGSLTPPAMAACAAVALL